MQPIDMGALASQVLWAAFGLAIGAGGNVRTQTMRAFSRDDMDGILAKMGKAK